MGIFFGCHSSPVDGFHSYLVNWGRERGGGAGTCNLDRFVDATVGIL